MNIVVENIKYIITPMPDGDLRILKNYDLLIEDNIIKCLSRKCEKPRDSITINGQDKIVMPGFINIHQHVGSYLLENLVKEYSSYELLSKLYGVEDKIDREYVELASHYTCLKLILTGTIGLLSTYPYAEEVVKTCSELGLYIATGPTYPYAVETININYDKLIPVASIYPIKYSDYNELVEAISKARDKGFKILVHLTGTRREVFLFRKTTGKWPVEYLYTYNLLGSDMVLAHLNWVSSMEINYLAENKPLINITPLTTMFLGERSFTPTYEILSRKIPISIGVEGFYNHDLNPWLELKIGYLLYKYSYGDNRIKQKQLLYHTLYQPYRFLGINGGSITEGTVANIIVFKYNGLDDPVNYIYSSSPTPEYVIVDGEVKLSPENRGEYIRKISFYANKLTNKISQIGCAK